MTQQKLLPKTLIVDDRQENLIALQAILEDLDTEVVQAMSGNEALSNLLDTDFALVLLDVQMPEMDGFEVAELMRANPDTQKIPIIFVTAISKEERHHFRGYEAGAVDYLNKPINTTILLSKVRIFLELWSEKEELKLANIRLQEANNRIKAQEQELRQLAIRDHLTGLYQRRWFDEMMLKEHEKAIRKHSELSLMMLDIDHFKQVNDTYGHHNGDLVLQSFAQIMTESTRNFDVVCRYGGEEFVVIMPETELNTALMVAERIRAAVEAHEFMLDQETMRATISIGVTSTVDASLFSVDHILEYADSLLYQAKRAGRNQVVGEVIKRG